MKQRPIAHNLAASWCLVLGASCFVIGSWFLEQHRVRREARCARVAHVRLGRRRGTWVLATGLAVLSCLLNPVPTVFAETNQPAAEAGRTAMGEAADFPWYNPDTDSTRPVELDATPELPGSPSWVSQSQAVDQTSTHGRWSWDWDLDWLGAWAQTVRFLVWCLLAVLLGWVLYYWLRALVRTLEQGEDDGDVTHRSEASLIEHLPFRVKRPTSDLLAEARHHSEAGRFNEAIVYLYSYQLVQLDRFQQIHLSQGKTNRQYLQELKQRRELQKILRQTILAFEDVYFGHYNLTRDRFVACWNQNETLHDLLVQSSAPRQQMELMA